MPLDFDISELRPQLIKLLGPGSTTSAASIKASKAEAAVDSAGAWSRSLVKTHCAGRHRPSRLFIGDFSQQDQLVKACMNSCRSQAPFASCLCKQASPHASRMPTSYPFVGLAGRRLACSHRTHRFWQVSVKV